jgi:hypothetical protein
MGEWDMQDGAFVDQDFYAVLMELFECPEDPWVVELLEFYNKYVSLTSQCTERRTDSFVEKYFRTVLEAEVTLQQPTGRLSFLKTPRALSLSPNELNVELLKELNHEKKNLKHLKSVERWNFLSLVLLL